MLHGSPDDHTRWPIGCYATHEIGTIILFSLDVTVVDSKMHGT